MTAPHVQTLLHRLEDFSYAEIEERNIELWEGEVVEKMSPAGIPHNRIIAKFIVLFDKWCEAHPTIDYAGDNDGFIVRRGEDRDTFLCPDAALYRRRDPEPLVWHEHSPEIVVEVASPDDSRPALLRKRDLYFTGGTEEYWLVLPRERVMEIHRPDRDTLSLSGAIVITEGLAMGLEFNLEKVLTR